MEAHTLSHTQILSIIKVIIDAGVVDMKNRNIDPQSDLMSVYGYFLFLKEFLERETRKL
jgi:hypothetical protein